MKSSSIKKSNINYIVIIIVAISIFGAVTFFSSSINTNNIPSNNYRDEAKISGSFDENKLKSEEEWKKILNEKQYHILREQGTERPYTGDLLDNKEKGTYVSVGCDQPVFRSEKKYDSRTGWPSFWAPIDVDSLVLKEDYLLGYKRVEIMDKCGGHLGHVFEDGPEPTGLRYCINSLALRFIPD